MTPTRILAGLAAVVAALAIATAAPAAADPKNVQQPSPGRAMGNQIYLVHV